MSARDYSSLGALPTAIANTRDTPLNACGSSAPPLRSVSSSTTWSVFKIRDAGGAPCRQVRELAAAKLDELEALVRDLTAMRDEMRELLKDWDRRLDSAPPDEPARLLETLAIGLASVRALAPLKPRHSTRAKKKEKQS